MAVLAEIQFSPFASFATLSIWHMIGVGALCLVTGYLVSAVYTVYFDPLSHIPGPKSAAVSHLWLFLQSMAGTRMYTIHDLHKKYNSKVRLS